MMPNVLLRIWWKLRRRRLAPPPDPDRAWTSVDLLDDGRVFYRHVRPNDGYWYAESINPQPEHELVRISADVTHKTVKFGCDPKPVAARWTPRGATEPGEAIVITGHDAKLRGVYSGRRPTLSFPIDRPHVFELDMGIVTDEGRSLRVVGRVDITETEPDREMLLAHGVPPLGEAALQWLAFDLGQGPRPTMPRPEAQR